MFPGMMDPEMLRLAQEQMSKFSPEDIHRMQQMMTPDMMRMAAESMRPEDMKAAMEQMKGLSPEQVAQMTSQMGPNTLQQASSMLTRKQQYEYNAAMSLKNEGNKLHAAGKFQEAAEKYSRAKANLAVHSSTDSKALKKSCTLNLMSCHLKTGHHSLAVREGTEVLKEDPRNVKALYRRGQALKEMGKLQAAVDDLSLAAEVSPLDDTLASVLQQAREQLGREKTQLTNSASSAPIIEEVDNDVPGGKPEHSPPAPPVADSPGSMNGSLPDDLGVLNGENMRRQLDMLTQNPQMMKTMQTMMASMDPAQLAAMSGSSMDPAMVAQAAAAMRGMSSEDLERMVRMASAMGGGMPPPGTAAFSAPVSQELSMSAATSAEPAPVCTASREPDGTSTAAGAGPGGRLGVGSADAMHQMREQMKNPQMTKMMSDMMQNMDPATMADLSRQMGVAMTEEQAWQAQQAMAGLSPERLSSLMAWIDSFGQAMERGRRARDWLLSRPTLLLAILLLVVAVLLQYLKVFGK